MMESPVTSIEAGLQDEVGTLRRALERLIAAAGGSRGRLDTHLATLRQLIAANAPAERIEAQVEAIAGALLKLNRPDGFTDGPGSDPLQQLLELLASSPVSASLQAEGRALQARLREDGSGAAWRDALQLTQHTLQQLATPGLLRRLFRRGSVGAARQPRIGDIPSGARAALIKLIDQLMLPDAVSMEVEQLRQRLADRIPLHDLADVVETLVALVATASRIENEALQHFLRQLNDRLLDLDGFLAHSAEQAAAGRNDGGELSRDVDAALQALHGQLVSAGSVAELRESLPRHLDVIGHRLRTYLTAGEQRRREDEVRLHRLARRLRETEADAESLRRSLMQQRVRSQIDTLTGLPNREAYCERLEHEYARWRRGRAPLSLVLCDVDHFKEVNDRLGHQAGDEVLEQMGQVFAQRLRHSDLVARYGGEEFVVLMPDTKPRDAFVVAEALREAIAAAHFTARDEAVEVTVSLGVAGFAPGDTPESVFERADEALYRAKRVGRNHTEMAAEREG